MIWEQENGIYKAGQRPGNLANRHDDVLRSTNLASSAFVCGATHLAATPPRNAYTDTLFGARSAFYKVRADRD